MARVRLDTLAAAPVEDVPGAKAATYSRLAVDRIAATPLNPRNDFTDTELKELGESLEVRQLQPIVVVPRGPYLRLWPEHAEHVGGADFVLVNGERRFRSARHVNLPSLDAMVREDVVVDRAAFLDALLKENIDRKNF